MNSRRIPNVSRSSSPSSQYDEVDEIGEIKRREGFDEPERVKVLDILQNRLSGCSSNYTSVKTVNIDIQQLESPKLSVKMQRNLEANGNLSENIIQNALKVIDASRVKDTEERDLKVELEIGHLKLHHLEKKVENCLQSSKDTLAMNAQLSGNVLNLLSSTSEKISSISPRDPLKEKEEVQKGPEHYIPTFCNENIVNKKNSLKRYVSQMTKNHDVSFEGSRESSRELLALRQIDVKNPNVSESCFSFNEQNPPSENKKGQNDEKKGKVCYCNGINFFQKRKILVCSWNQQEKGYLIKPQETLSVQRLEPIIIHPPSKSSDQKVKSKFVECLRTEGDASDSMNENVSPVLNNSELERSRKENSKGGFVNNIMEYIHNQSRGSPYADRSSFDRKSKAYDSRSSLHKNQNTDEEDGFSSGGKVAENINIERAETNSNRFSEHPTDSATPQNHQFLRNTSTSEMKTMETANPQLFKKRNEKAKSVSDKSEFASRTEATPVKKSQSRNKLLHRSSSSKKANPSLIQTKSTLDSIHASSNSINNNNRSVSTMRNGKKVNGRDSSTSSMQRSLSSSTPMKNRSQNRSSIKTFAIGKDWEAVLNYDSDQKKLQKYPHGRKSSPRKDSIPKLIVNLFTSKTSKH